MQIQNHYLIREITFKDKRTGFLCYFDPTQRLPEGRDLFVGMLNGLPISLLHDYTQLFSSKEYKIREWPV